MRSVKTAKLAIAVAVFSIVHQAMAYPLASSTIQAGLRIKISVPDSDRPDFFVPVKEKGEPAAAVIPALPDKDGEGLQERPSFIRIVPQKEGDSVRIKVSVLYGTVDRSLPPTEQLKSLKEKPVTNSLVTEGEKITVSELKRFGLRTIEVEVVSSQ